MRRVARVPGGQDDHESGRRERQRARSRKQGEQVHDGPALREAHEAIVWPVPAHVPRDRAKDYVFRPPLEMTRHGVVHARASDLAGGAPAREVCRHLKSLKEVLRLSGSRYGYVGLGDESGAEWMPLLLPWSASGDGEFKPENVLKKLGAHPHLQQHCQANEFAALRAFEAVSKVPIGSGASPTLHFSAGRDALNPVPCFAVRLVRDDLAVGFIGGIVLT